MVKVLRQRNFALLWFGGLISLAGDWMLFIALPVYVYQLTGSTLATGTMLMVSFVPTLLLGSLAGVFADRWDRKRLMVVSNLLLALCLLPLLLVRSLDTLWIVYLVSFVKSCIVQFFSPAENAVLPTLVDEQDLVPANALNSLNNSLGRLIGPALGGLVAAWTGLQGVVLFDSVSFLVAAGMIALIQMPRKSVAEAEQPVTPQARGWGTLWREWLQGLRVVRSEYVVSVLFAIVAITAVGEGILTVLLVVFVTTVLQGGSIEVGYLMSAQAVGGLLGGTIVGWLGRKLLPFRLLGWSAILFGLGDLALFNAPLFVQSLPLELFIIAAVGIPAVGFGTSVSTLFQTNVADEYRGRVFGALGTTQAVLILIGMAFASTWGERIGVIPMLNIQGGGYVLAGILGLALLGSTRRQAHRATLGDSVIAVDG